ncbi:MAG TPA: hypothetical protein VKG26_13330 [Bacteroidia bacterium]|nr:hypothetical protein [Bacteroidia bacterium]
MEKTILKKGDFVKTDYENTPEMKIIVIQGLKAKCYWFDKNQAPHEAIFFLSELTLIKSANELETKEGGFPYIVGNRSQDKNTY